MKLLSGHTSPETAYVVDDYPYGFRLRCKIRYWLEHHPKHGTRLVSQTTNPKKPYEYWNTPKPSTYCKIAGAMYLDEQDHVTWSGLSIYSGVEECKAWMLQFEEAIPIEVAQRVKDWIEEKEVYSTGGKVAWIELKAKRLGVNLKKKETHKEHSERRLGKNPAVHCSSVHVTFGGGCLNCGYDPNPEEVK